MPAPRHFLPGTAPHSETQEDAARLLIPVVDSPGPGLTRLFLGNLTAAEDVEALAGAGITASLNLAMNIFPGPLTLPDGTQMRRYQIGLLDGPGNAPQLFEAAIRLIDGLAATYTEGKPHYPPHRPGGLLVHCRGGRSRSIAILALWLHLRRRADFPDLDAALTYLRGLRGLDNGYPLPPMIALARQAQTQLSASPGR